MTDKQFIEQFDGSTYLPKGYYPWTDAINPHVEQMGKEMDEWIDTDYTVLPQKVREKYKKMVLHDCMARMTPYLSEDKIRPLNRFMLYLTSFDDQHELCSSAGLEECCKRMMEIMDGDAPGPEERGWYSQLALVRDEMEVIMPGIWMQRFTEELSDFVLYGMGGEVPFKTVKHTPSLANYLAFREYSIGMRPFLIAAEWMLSDALPEVIARHPVLRRLLALAARIVAWQNDIHSLRKEYGKETETLNLVLVLQHEFQLSLEEAVKEAMRIHDADVAEFVSLHTNLPDFGEYNEAVDTYVAGLGIQAQAINSYYLASGTRRYLIRGAGFAWPEQQSRTF